MSPIQQAETRVVAPNSVSGTARLGLKTKRLVGRLSAGDIAVIKHPDLDAISAEELIESGVRGVVNNLASSTGRYPNRGPLTLTDAGITLLDVLDVDLFAALKDGQTVTIVGDELMNGSDDQIASGELCTRSILERRERRSREQLTQALAEFADNTVAHMREEVGLLAGDYSLPAVETVFRGRDALIVVRGSGYKRDLRVLRSYIRDVRPVLVGVDGGAEALLEFGLKPDLVIGDMDSASDRVLQQSTELVVHAYTDGQAPGAERLDDLGLDYKIAPVPGTSQDLAMLLANDRGASLIVSVGSHFNLVEFLDKDRAGMSSTFLTRLRVGEALVDAKGVSKLYRPSPRPRHLVAMLVAALITVVIVVLLSPPLERLIELLWLKLRVSFG